MMFSWLELLVNLLVEKALGMDPASHWGGAVSFFIFDTIKIVILLSVMIFLISYLRSYVDPVRFRKRINRFSGFWGHILASLFGIVTPFCSCSSIPLFITFVETGIPVGVTMSFLITSPIVNEAAFAMLIASFGWKIALLYTICGVAVGVVGGMMIRLFKPERWVEPYVYQIKVGDGVEGEKKTQSQRIGWAWGQVTEIVRRIWVYILVGIGIGAGIHGWVPDGALADYAGADNPFAVIVAVVFGIPLYSNALGTIPIAEALIRKGVGLGTALAFMMAVTALSLPECIILRKVIKPRLIALFITITGLGIILVGYLFNAMV